MKLLSVVVLVLLVGGWVVLNQVGGAKYRSIAKLQMEELRLKPLVPPMLYILEHLKIMSKFPLFFFKIQRSVQKLNGQRHSAEKTLLYVGEMMCYSWLLLVMGCLLTLAMGEATGLGIGIVLGLLLPAAMIKDLHSKVQKRDQDILMELPELLNKIVLLVGAGETVQKAISHCVEQKKQENNHPLYRELIKMTDDLEGGYSFQQSFENFSKRCAVQEVSIFTTTVLLNFRRGGNDFEMALTDLSRVLWEKRKAVTRIRGEQASSKLIFPMVVIFVIVIVLVGTPAFMMMNM
ncbi:type II secretion system F family protein [Paenibacillus sp. KQZ6P-2]|uniref:Type II secretion system F family protein n=1 Tax=Paenibacillus mangrovi TaxID=2931978 RepID=A0A9X2B3N3_9BACL|nr:type II secretion system F family protein [Paenibacillus mangrovi]MCJ8013140.1 type II secretion system F family protein [Paenibacillus mangrovi]